MLTGEKWKRMSIVEGTMATTTVTSQVVAIPTDKVEIEAKKKNIGKIKN